MDSEDHHLLNEGHEDIGIHLIRSVATCAPVSIVVRPLLAATAAAASAL